jgi:hypothetical protein
MGYWSFRLLEKQIGLSVLLKNAEKPNVIGQDLNQESSRSEVRYSATAFPCYDVVVPDEGSSLVQKFAQYILPVLIFLNPLPT